MDSDREANPSRHIAQSASSAKPLHGTARLAAEVLFLVDRACSIACLMCEGDPTLVEQWGNLRNELKPRLELIIRRGT